MKVTQSGEFQNIGIYFIANVLSGMQTTSILSRQVIISSIRTSKWCATGGKSTLFFILL